MAIGFGISTLSAKYDQTATLLRQGHAVDSAVEGSGEDEDLNGHYVIKTHPITGEIIRIWEEGGIPDNPYTDIDESTTVAEFKCQARPVITGGLNSQGTSQRWTTKGSYENVEYVELYIPKGVVVTKRDRVTNIKDSRGRVIWREEEHGNLKPTVFSVRGVAPSLDPFGSVVEYFALLERAEIQGGTEGAEEGAEE